MSLDITATDLFCGAGGSSDGIVRAGVRLVMAANHWPLAIETHSANFPHADHDCANISQVDPRRYPSTDILIASPECTNHSSAKTNKHNANLFDPHGDPAEERSRATMWDVPRFAERHRYQIVIVENVVEARKWEPYAAWIHAMRSLGYNHKALYLNSFIAHPTPQSRDRMYVVFWRKGNKAPNLDFRPQAWCPKCETDVDAIQTWKNGRTAGKYRSQYFYRCPHCATVALPYAWPAAAAIDWSIKAPRIGDRKRPLTEATMRRIRVGLERYGYSAIVQASGHLYERPGYYRTWPTWLPLGTQTTRVEHALVIDTNYSHDGSARHVRTVSDPMPTQTIRQSQALVVPLRTHGKAEPADRTVFPTIVAGNAGHALLIRQYSGGVSLTRPISEPAGTITSIDHHALVVPFLIDYHGQGKAQSVNEPSGTIDTRDRRALLEPGFDIEDCGFRMLEPHEIGRAMAFKDTYIVKGNKREQVRQYGNAVTPPMMTKIGTRCLDSLA